MLQVIRAAALASVLAVSSNARADTRQRWDAGTVAEQAGGGLVGGVVLGAGGGLLGMVLGSGASHQGDWGTPLAIGALGALAGYTIGVIATVDYVGDHRGLDGSGLATTLGEVGGIAVFSLIELGFAKAHARLPFSAHVVLGLACTLTGPIVGYQLSASDSVTVARVPVLAFRF